MKKTIVVVLYIVILFAAAHTWLRAEQRSSLPDWHQDPEVGAPFLWE